MKKFMLALFILLLIPVTAFATNFHVSPSLLQGVPNFSCGPEYDTTMIDRVEFADQSIYLQEQKAVANLNEYQAKLQREADSNVKKLSLAVERKELNKLEESLRNKALSKGATVTVKDDGRMWKVIYKTVYPNRAVRQDEGIVDYKTSKCYVVTRVDPYGAQALSEAQFKLK